MTEKDILRYIDNVASGKKLTGELERLAIQRHVKDLNTCYERGLFFDPKAGMRVVNFYHFLNHGKGRQFAKKPFELSDWQAFKVYCQYGWKRENNKRRFRLGYLDVGRKNGKTAFAGGECLYNMIADGETSAEIYSAATTFPQAAICFEDTKAILNHSPKVKSMLNVFKKSIVFESTGSKFMPLHAKSDHLDGLNPSFAVIDEYHAHPNNDVFDILETGMGARDQPMISIITTAGYNKFGPCFRFRDIAKKVLHGILTQDDLFVMIFAMDNDDDWHNDEAWFKCNPNMGVSFQKSYMMDMFKAALNSPDKVVPFKTKNLNLWVDAENVWIPDESWKECSGVEMDLKGLKCTGGLDLSSVRDITALCLMFIMPDGTDVYKWFFFIPQDNINKRVKDDMVPYDIWIKQGHIITTPGNVTDYSYIHSYILSLNEIYNITSIAFDRWNASQLVINLQNDGMVMNPFGQGFASMSSPTKAFETSVYAKKMYHFNNPVARWMISNVDIKRDAAGNIKIDKERSREKVDGIVAAVMAKGESMTFNTENKANLNKIYENRGIRVL